MISVHLILIPVFRRTLTDWNSLPLAVRLLTLTQSFHGSAELGTLQPLLIIITLRR